MNLKKYTAAKLITTVASVATLLAGWGIIHQAAGATAATNTATAVSQPASTSGSSTASSASSQPLASAQVTTRTHVS